MYCSLRPARTSSVMSSAGSAVITADASLDITEDVLAGLNDEYIKTKNEKK